MHGSIQSYKDRSTNPEAPTFPANKNANILLHQHKVKTFTVIAVKTFSEQVRSEQDSDGPTRDENIWLHQSK
jgi:hypothetical protein